MPSKSTLKKITPTNPFAVCGAQAKKTGMSKGKNERCIEHVTQSALKKKRKRG